MTKQQKAQNLNTFLESYLPLLEAFYEVRKHEAGYYSFRYKTFGQFDVYPKSQRMLIRKENRWVSNCFKLFDKYIL